jgi:hypothetical protein
MACTDSPDQLIQQILNAPDFTYNLAEDKLELRTSDQKVMVLQRTE